MESVGLAKLDQATQMLAEVRTIDDAKELIDLAEAARIYARQVKLGLEAQNHAAEIKIRAQRRAGEILEAMEKNDGGRPTGNRLQPVTGFDPPTYGELGIYKRDAHVWRTIAAIPEAEFEETLADVRQTGQELSTAMIYREARLGISKQNKVEAPPLEGKYRIIYADPPWKYGDKLIEGYGAAEHHYPVMSIEELNTLPIRELAEDDAVLFLWATSPLLQEAFEVIKSWGFEYKASFVWDKVKHNFGHYNSVRHEFLLVCTRGSCTPDAMELFDSVQSIERTDHSTKPEEFRRIIDTLYTHGKRIELFARREVEGWERWGNEPITTSQN